MKRISNVFLSIILTIFMVCGVSVPVKSATVDPYLIATSNTPYTQIVAKGDSTYLSVSPSNDYYTATGFDTEEDAMKVKWSLVQGSTSGVELGEASVLETADGKYISTIPVDVTLVARAGCASIEAKLSDTCYVNLTIIVNNYTLPACNVQYRIYPEGGMTTQAPAKSGRILALTSNSYQGTMHYPNVADSIAKLKQDNIIDGYDIVKDTSKALYSYYLNSMIVDEQTYSSHSDEAYQYYGWQYRVYDRRGKIIKMSEYVGIDECELRYGNTIVWQFGKYGEITFPERLPALGAPSTTLGEDIVNYVFR